MIHFLKHPFFAFFYKNFIVPVVFLTLFITPSTFTCTLNLGCQYLSEKQIEDLAKRHQNIPQTPGGCFLKDALHSPFRILLAINKKLTNIKSYSINPCAFSIPSALASFKAKRKEDYDGHSLENHTRKLLLHFWFMLEFPHLASKIQRSISFRENAKIALNKFIINEDQYNFLIKTGQ